MHIREFDVKRYLIPYRGCRVDFFRFPGNYGDSLIWHGTMKMLGLLGITTHNVEITSPPSNSTLLIDGGGNLVDYYSDVRNFLKEKPGLYDRIIILPHTIFGDEQINTLNNVSSELIVFCRERVTANLLVKSLYRAKVFLWHDCAFYNDFLQTKTGTGTLNAFREDKESALREFPDSNIDLSRKGYATKPLIDLISSLRKYNRVHTDRLHLAIAATLLGKKVQLFPNSYYKNKAVYDYSLRRFPNVRFIDNANGPPHD